MPRRIQGGAPRQSDGPQLSIIRDSSAVRVPVFSCRRDENRVAVLVVETAAAH